MATLTPYSGLSTSRLTAMINQDNRSALRYGVDFTFGQLEPFAGNGGRNTRVKLVSLKPQRYRDEWVYYRRLPLTALDRLPEGTVKPVTIASLPFSIHQILPQLNTALGLDLVPSEVEDAIFSTPQSDYPLRIVDANSVAWHNSDFHFKAVFPEPPVEMWLSERLPNTQLSGLFYGNS